MSKPHATTDECLLLIRSKRMAAKAAMRKIIFDFAIPREGDSRQPDVETLLDYLTNMIYCIEMTLKILSNNWDSHNVGVMYASAFRSAHPDLTLMAEIKAALTDQKYLFEPRNGLLSRVEGIEHLFDELKQKLVGSYPKYGVRMEIPAPASFLKYVRDNPRRFYKWRGKTMKTFPTTDELERVGRMAEQEIELIESAFRECADKKREFFFFHGEFSATWADM